MTISLTIVATVLLAAASSFSSSINAVNTAQRRSRSSVFLETVMQNIAAQPYDNLATLDGDRILDGATANTSNYAVDLTVFLAAVDLEEIQAVLTDLHTNRPICSITTLRSRR